MPKYVVSGEICYGFEDEIEAETSFDASEIVQERAWQAVAEGAGTCDIEFVDEVED